ncbi:MAG: hypothetical protein U9Q61_10540, partial [Thermodesulfobacteriota bacterium]|nr:hypothetical protein [Thermodesulfobacteriota bacterium]
MTHWTDNENENKQANSSLTKVLCRTVLILIVAFLFYGTFIWSPSSDMSAWVSPVYADGDGDGGDGDGGDGDGGDG